VRVYLSNGPHVLGGSVRELRGSMVCAAGRHFGDLQETKVGFAGVGGYIWVGNWEDAVDDDDCFTVQTILYSVGLKASGINVHARPFFLGAANWRWYLTAVPRAGRKTWLN
jgi:hypothetical protein